MAKPKKLVALMRALNVGGHTVKMEDLRAMFSALGLANVESFIASGNIIFDAPGGAQSLAARASLEKKIAAHLEQALGYPVATFLRSPEELAAAADYAAFDPAAVALAHSLHLAFMHAAPAAAALEKVLALSDAVNLFHVHGRELYWLRQAGQDVSPFSGAHIEKALGAPVTARNITTVRKLAAKYGVTA